MAASHDSLSRYMAGACAGFVELMATHPLDYLKTHRQTNAIYEGGSCTKVCTKEASVRLRFRHLYMRGFVARALGVVPSRLLFWGVQDNVTARIANDDNDDVRSRSRLHPPHSRGTATVAGIAGGCATSIVDVPVERVKVWQMTAPPATTCSASPDLRLRTCSSMCTWYTTGWAPTLGRNVIFAVCVSCLCTDRMRVCVDVKHAHATTHFANASVAAMAGAIGSMLTQPLDYIKTMQQVHTYAQPKGLEWYRVIRHDPLRMYAGVGTRALLNSVAMGVGLVAYDVVYAAISRERMSARHQSY